MLSLDSVRYTQDVLGVVGATPLVRLQRVVSGVQAAVLAKLEYLNPGGSSKDRVAVAMVEYAERSGLLRPGGTIVEPTSGNTGAALAMVAAVRGYRCVLVVPAKTSSEKVAAMRAFGAEVVVADPSQSYTALAAQIARDVPGSYVPDQYNNPVNPLAHERTTAVEIWEQTAGQVTHVVAGLGTGGTICGIARALRARKRDVTIVGVDPHGSVYSGGTPENYALEGIGRNYLPKTLDLRVIDRIERVSDRDAFVMARRAAAEEGLLVGGSSGAALVAASRIAREAGEDGLVVVVLPDSGRAYFSKIFNDAWMAEHGFAGTWTAALADVVRAKAGVSPEPFVPSDISLRAVRAKMAEAGVETCAVVDDDCHVGRMSIHLIMEVLRHDPRRLDVTVAEVMGPPFPLFDETEPLDDAYRALRNGQPRVVVTRAGKPVATLTAGDLAAFVLDE